MNDVTFQSGSKDRNIGAHSPAPHHTISIKSKCIWLRRLNFKLSRTPQPPTDFASFNDANYDFFSSSDGSMHIVKANGHMEMRALCEQINKQTPTESQIIVHQTSGW